LVRKRFAQVGANLLILALVLFLSSGELGWGMAWVYLGLNAAVVVATGIVLLQVNPQVIAERTRTGPGTPTWDRVLVTLYAVSGLIIPMISGLDRRLGWTEAIPPVVQGIGVLLFMLGGGLGVWAMGANAYFATTVRIQDERGQRVVSVGPYRYVRHPAYSGWMVSNLAVPVVLDSLWAFIPAGLALCILVVRTALEDSVLQDELAGYREYAARVRHRLLPGIW
jgi:protein-S-isoprenylcysteine O-methyltransferase Ste14